MCLTCLACSEPSSGLLCPTCTAAGVVAYRYPSRPWTLNAERRDHWTQSRALTREWREAFAWLAMRDRRRFSSCSITVIVQMRPPMQDTGNAYGAAKAAIDGLVDAGVLPNDGPDVVRLLTFRAPSRADRNVAESLTLLVAPH